MPWTWLPHVGKHCGRGCPTLGCAVDAAPRWLCCGRGCPTLGRAVDVAAPRWGALWTWLPHAEACFGRGCPTVGRVSTRLPHTGARCGCDCPTLGHVVNEAAPCWGEPWTRLLHAGACCGWGWGGGSQGHGAGVYPSAHGGGYPLSGRPANDLPLVGVFGRVRRGAKPRRPLAATLRPRGDTVPPATGSTEIGG